MWFLAVVVAVALSSQSTYSQTCTDGGLIGQLQTDLKTLLENQQEHHGDMDRVLERLDEIRYISAMQEGKFLQMLYQPEQILYDNSRRHVACMVNAVCYRVH